MDTGSRLVNDARQTLDRFGFGWPYRVVAEGCARVIASRPALERAFVRASRVLWSSPVAGRFCRSVAYRVADRLREKGDVYREIPVATTPLRADITHWMFSGQYLGNVEYEAATGRYLARHLRSGGVFVDVGANIGYFSLLAAGRVGPTGRVFAFEPNPPVYDALQRHVALNGFTDRIRPMMSALSDRSTNDSRLYVTNSHSGFSSLDPERAPGAQHLAGGHSVVVSTDTFDGWFARECGAIDTVDVVKIDVEGAERHVLSGMETTLANRRIARLVVETEWDGPAHRMLVSYGYEPEVLEDVGQILNIAYTRPS